MAASADALRWPQYGQTDIMKKYDRISTYLLNSRQWGISQWGESSIACTELSTDDSEPRYYNLQGVRITHPAADRVVIKVQGNAVEKIHVR